MNKEECNIHDMVSEAVTIICMYLRPITILKTRVFNLRCLKVQRNR
ncbi:hypothetical protein NARC_30027 [Candidatus Nitrosocosmicus arcticus]|uniref:Uncharacterized protein n=1 Tax=Candidatus Nitrosocosmicus arcticus TaxID=2035267 RepID=A0A557SXJ1_9ARCH|nr:hypothetical protein NARC_30027 [Candidatus Nitrosocosmicus arcticus]